LNTAFSRTREVDDRRAYPLNEVMSRPLLLLTLSLVGLSLTLAGCRTSTPYTRMYSPRKSYYVAPIPKSEKSAEELLKATEAAKLPGADGTVPGGLPPADPNAIPGLPPAAAPAVDPLAPPPAAPPAN
jgi:hypothetical protein